MLTLASGLVNKMLTDANKGTYLVKIWQEYANIIYELSLTKSQNCVLAPISLKSIGAEAPTAPILT